MVDSPRFVREVMVNLQDDSFFGWQSSVNGLVVRAMMLGLSRGLSYSPVNVVARDDSFIILHKDNDPFDRELFFCGLDAGGHHRAVAHYYSGLPLPCLVYDRHVDDSSFRRQIVDRDRLVHPRDIMLDYAHPFADGRLIPALSRLSLDDAKAFCYDNMVPWAIVQKRHPGNKGQGKLFRLRRDEKS